MRSWHVCHLGVPSGWNLPKEFKFHLPKECKLQKTSKSLWQGGNSGGSVQLQWIWAHSPGDDQSFAGREFAKSCWQRQPKVITLAVYTQFPLGPRFGCLGPRLCWHLSHKHLLAEIFHLIALKKKKSSGLETWPLMVNFHFSLSLLSRCKAFWKAKASLSLWLWEWLSSTMVKDLML